MGRITPFDDDLQDLARELAAKDRGDVWSAPPQSLLRAVQAPPAPPPRPRANWLIPGAFALVITAALTAVVLIPVEDFRPAATPAPPPVGVIAAPLVASTGALPDWAVTDPEPPPQPPPKAAPKPRVIPAKAVVKSAAPAPKTLPPLDFSGLEKVGTAPPRIAPSFDCGRAGSEAERLVCDDARLSAADRAVAEAYRRAETAGVSRRALRRQQQQWLAAREQAAQDQPDALVQVYERRMDELHLQAERAEAARR